MPTMAIDHDVPVSGYAFRHAAEIEFEIAALAAAFRG
jgi:hypothetical protein